MPHPLTPTQLESWERDGFLHVVGVLDGPALDELRTWVDEVSVKRDGDDDLLQHYEATAAGAQVCRTENLLHHCGFRALLTEGTLPAMGAALVGEPVLLYKEKINYKLAGGAGFAPHQDAPAYPFIDTHLTAMVAIDDADPTNGSLDLVAGMHAEVLRTDTDGCIHPSLIDQMSWQPTTVRAGDVLWFHSRTPHRSGPNTSERPRRALFCTYNAAAEGELRTTYYEAKRAHLKAQADSPDGRTRVSIIGDFQGRAPTREQISALEAER